MASKKRHDSIVSPDEAAAMEDGTLYYLWDRIRGSDSAYVLCVHTALLLIWRTAKGEALFRRLLCRQDTKSDPAILFTTDPLYRLRNAKGKSRAIIVERDRMQPGKSYVVAGARYSICGGSTFSVLKRTSPYAQDLYYTTLEPLFEQLRGNMVEHFDELAVPALHYSVPKGGKKEAKLRVSAELLRTYDEILRERADPENPAHRRAIVGYYAHEVAGHLMLPAEIVEPVGVPCFCMAPELEKWRSARLAGCVAAAPGIEVKINEQHLLGKAVADK